MKRTLLQLLIASLFLLSISSFAQSSKCNNIIIAENVLQGGDFLERPQSCVWPYIWDLPLDSFEDVFVVVEIRRYGKSAHPQVVAIRKEQYDEEPVLITYNSDEVLTKNIRYFFPTETHGELFNVHHLSYIEVKRKNGYGRCYNISMDHMYEKGTLEKKRDKGYYSEV